MGGLDTEIGPATTNVLIEAAQFDAMSIRKTARRLGLHSPSSYRFERPLDPEATEWASRRCAELILEMAGGTLHPGVIDVGGRPARAARRSRSGSTRSRASSGSTIDRATVVADPAARSAWSRSRPPATSLTLPPAELAERPGARDRPDRGGRADPRLRAHPRGPRRPADQRPAAPPRAGRGRGPQRPDRLRVRRGGHLQPRRRRAGRAARSPARPVPPDPGRAFEPASARTRCGRAWCPSLLAARRHNEAHGNADAELFEIANVYLPRPGQPLPDEPTRLALVAGRDFLGLKGVVEALLDRLHAGGGLEARPADGPAVRARPLRPSCSWAAAHLGYLGEVDRGGSTRWSFARACAAAELELDVLHARADLVPRHRPLAAVPGRRRATSRWSSRGRSPGPTWPRPSRHAAGPTLEAVVYLDTFQGGNVPEGKQSLHFGLRFRHPERTLTGDEVERAVDAIVDACATRFEATLRAPDPGSPSKGDTTAGLVVRTDDSVRREVPARTAGPASAHGRSTSSPMRQGSPGASRGSLTSARSFPVSMRRPQGHATCGNFQISPAGGFTRWPFRANFLGTSRGEETLAPSRRMPGRIETSCVAQEGLKSGIDPSRPSRRRRSPAKRHSHRCDVGS